MALSQLVLVAALLGVGDAFRILQSPADPAAATRAVFQPYVHGGVGYYGDPTNPDPERVDEGAPFSPDTPRLYFSGTLKQNCPGMVGPINEEEYYCHSREYGYCDRRSGLCVCNQGYTGLECTECKPSYFRKGSLCYPKKSCPNDCSRAGVCDYATGTCTCALHRSGDDCAKVVCRFDAKCTSCTATACLSCIEGFYVDPATQTCLSCKTYDPRCLVCDASRCLQCADPLLNSVRRSGARNVDAPLPFDELSREFSFLYSYGSQDPRVFDEAEVFELSSSPTFLNDTSVRCVQGQRFDASWTCTPNPVSHRVCGHAGVFSFTSPVYAVPESAQNITLTVQRSGGGLGAAAVTYDLQHISTTPQDVSPTAFYTSSQTLIFAPGVVNISFLLTIHEDRQVEPDEAFRVVLRSPSDGSSLGPQRHADVTIFDNDRGVTDATLTYLVPSSGTALEKGGFAGDALSFQVQAVLGDGSTKKTGGDILLMESYVADERVGTTASSLYRQKLVGQVTDYANGTYTIAWQRKSAGNYTVSVYLLYAGGLRGDYYADAWLSASPVVSRVDRQVNFTWNRGPIFPGASDYVGVRWSGRLKPKVTGDTTFYLDYDDHVRLWIGDVLLIDRWSVEHDGGAQVQATMTLDSTQYYALQLEYRDLTGDAHVYLSWSAQGLTKEVIPPTSLYTAQHIRESPFSPIPILPALTSHPTTSYLQGTFRTIAGTPLTLTLFPVDVYGNARSVYDPKVDVNQATLSLVTDQSLGGVGSKTVACPVQWKSESSVFTVTCVPFFSGVHSLNLYLSSVLITGSPFSVTVDPNRMHPTRSVLSGPGLTNARVAGTPTTINLETRDLYNNRIYSTSGPSVRLTARAIHTTRTGVYDLGTVVDNTDGIYTFTYTPRFVGSYQIHVTQNGTHIHNSPYTVTVVPNVADGSTSGATGTSLSAATTNVQSSFQIQSRDANANDLVAGGAVYQVILENSKGNVTGACTDLLNSKYACTYTPKYVGSTNLHVGLLRTSVFYPIIGSPFALNVVAGPALGSLSFAQGAALVSSISGQTARFTVVIHDASDNEKRNAGSETVAVAFVGPAPSTATVAAANTGLVIVYNGDGTYTVSYNLQVKGAYKIQVSVNSVAIVGSPFTMYNYPASASYSTTTIDLVLPTMTPLTFYAGALVTTRITTRDAFGNVLESGGSRFLVDRAFENTSLVVTPARVVDEANGSYVFAFTPTNASLYRLNQRILYPGGFNGTYYGSPDVTGPAKLNRIDATIDWDFGNVAPIQTDDRETFSIQWNGYVLPQFTELYTLYATVTGGCRMRLGDQTLFASLWPNATNATAHATLQLVANALVPLQLNFSKPVAYRNASVRLEWASLSQPRQVIPSSRLLTAWTFINNVPPLSIAPDVADSPSFTTVFPPSSVVDPSVVTATSGVALVFHVTARDRFGNQRLVGGDRISVLFPQLPDGATITPTVVDLGNAVYEITITPILRGDFSMVVAATRLTDDIHAGTGTESLIERLRPFFIRQSQFTLRVVPNTPLASTSTLVGDGIAQAIAGIPSYFTVELRDLNSNRIQQPLTRDKIIVRLRHLTIPNVAVDGAFPDAVDGYVHVNYTATVSGMYEIVFAVLDGVLVSKTSSLHARPNLASALTSSASGAGLGPQVQAQTPLSFTISLRDFYQNPMETDGNDLAVVLRGPTTMAADVLDVGTNQYVVQYTLPLAGTYEIQSVLANPGFGLVGSYFETTRFAAVELARATQWVDPRLDFDWRANETMRNYPRIQWRGYLKPLYTETYTLRLSVAPVAAVYIDTVPVIDALNVAPVDGIVPTVVEGKVNLVGARLHRIVVEYRSPSRRDVYGSLRLEWRSDRQQNEIIPTTAFRPDGQEIPPRFTIVAV